jgi:hypothetical protein
MNLPFIENKQEGHFLRTFSEQVDETDLLWHRDLEDRIVEPTTPTDWKLQLEDQLPENINKQIFIPRLHWHRLIKGTDNLTLKLIKL